MHGFTLWVVFVNAFSFKVAKYFFTEPRKADGLIIFFGLFFGYLVSTMVKDIHSVKSGNDGRDVYFKFQTDEDSYAIPQGAQLIGTTSRYLFFWNPTRKSSVAIDRDEVRTLTTTKAVNKLSEDEINSMAP